LEDVISWSKTQSFYKEPFYLANLPSSLQVVIEAAEQVLKKADKLSRQYNKIPEYDGSRKVSSAPSKARPGVLSPSKAAQIAKPGSPLKAAVVNEEDNIPLAKRRKFLFQNLVSTAEETDAKPKQKCSFELPTNIGAAETLFTKTSNQPPNEPEIIDSNQPPNEPEIIDLLHDSEPEDVKEEDVEQEVARKPTQLDASAFDVLLTANGLPNTPENRAWAIGSLSRSRSRGRG